MQSSLRLFPSLLALCLAAAAQALTTITPATHEVGAGSVPYQILVTSDGDWAASTAASWVTLSRTGGLLAGNILVTAAINLTGADRMATIVVGGTTHTLTQRSFGTAIQEIWAWGNDTYGQLGDNSALREKRPSPVQIAAGEVQSVAAGGDYSLAVKADGSLWAWGRNSDGQLGDATWIDRPGPVQIMASGVQSVAAGLAHTLIVKTDGSLWGTGSNRYGTEYLPRGQTQSLCGQLGDVTLDNQSSPIRILDGGVRSVAAGTGHSLVVKTDGSLWGMGDNREWQLGRDTVLVAKGLGSIVASGVRSVAAGGRHSLIVKTDGSLWAMGRNWEGQLGLGYANYYEGPVQVMAGGVQSVAAGGNHSLIVKTDGSLWAMGDNQYGQLGDGSTTDRLSPVQILSSGVRAVAAGTDHSLILKTDGNLWAMGSNFSGQVGDTTTTDRTSPVPIARNVRTLAAGCYHSIVVASGDFILDPPVVWAQPMSQTVFAGDDLTLIAQSPGLSSSQWHRDNIAVTDGMSGGTFTLHHVTSADAGIYDAVLSFGGRLILSAPAVVGIVPVPGERTAGSVATRGEWQDIHHPNGAVYDQFVLTGAAGTFSADPGQIARCSYLDSNDSIVQVEMSGAGAITIVLAGATGPLAPVLYNQPGIQYMKGKATIILAGADETSHFTIYSVGTATNPAVTRSDVSYNGWADVAVAGIVSSNGGLGSIHQGNVSYNAGAGYTGIYAPTVTTVGGPVVVHGIEAYGAAQPYLAFGPHGGVSVKIAGSSLGQRSTNSVSVRGLGEVQMGAGQDSCGRAAPAQVIATVLLDEAEIDRTAELVVGP